MYSFIMYHAYKESPAKVRRTHFIWLVVVLVANEVEAEDSDPCCHLVNNADKKIFYILKCNAMLLLLKVRRHQIHILGFLAVQLKPGGPICCW